jgi:hypothetical protein
MRVKSTRAPSLVCHPITRQQFERRFAQTICYSMGGVSLWFGQSEARHVPVSHVAAAAMVVMRAFVRVFTPHPASNRSIDVFTLRRPGLTWLMFVGCWKDASSWCRRWTVDTVPSFADWARWRSLFSPSDWWRSQGLLLWLSFTKLVMKPLLRQRGTIDTLGFAVVVFRPAR